MNCSTIRYEQRSAEAASTNRGAGKPMHVSFNDPLQRVQSQNVNGNADEFKTPKPDTNVHDGCLLERGGGGDRTKGPWVHCFAIPVCDLTPAHDHGSVPPRPVLFTFETRTLEDGLRHLPLNTTVGAMSSATSPHAQTSARLPPLTKPTARISDGNHRRTEEREKSEDRCTFRS